MAVGAKLREFRTRRGWSTRKLAAELGVSPPMISNYERGITRIDADELPRMADLLGVQPAAFFGEEPRPLTMAAIISGLETLASSHDNQVTDPSALPARNGSHPASNGGHLEDDREPYGRGLLEQYVPVVSAAAALTRELVLVP